MLWIALYLPELPLQIVERATLHMHGETPSAPFVIKHGAEQRLLVFAANPAAHQAGICSGMTVAAAQALSGELSVLARDVAAEHAALHNLAAWAGQFTPAVTIESGQGLLLEVGTCLKLFKGLPKLLNLVRRGIHELGYHTAVGVAPTARAAWLLAKASVTQTGVRSCTELAELPSRLNALPLTLFDWAPATLSALQDLAVITVAQFRALPRDGAIKRFGPEPAQQLDQAFGLTPDPRLYHTPPEIYRARIEFLQEVTQVEALLFSIKRMLLELEGFLRARGAGVQQFVLLLEHQSRNKLRSRISVGLLAPERDAVRLLALARERLEHHLPSTPVLAISLQADAPLPYAVINHSLLPDTRNQTLGWRQLRERLQARLGQDKLFVLQAGNDHRPEFATVLAGEGNNRHAKPPCHPQPRPLWLLPEPKKLALVAEQPQYHGALTLTAGPERIETGWWDAQLVNRDYYVACNESGETLWIYREHQRQEAWFLHGLFA